MRKVMWRLPPLMALMFLINQLDRVNVSFAALTMNRDIGLDTISLYAVRCGSIGVQCRRLGRVGTQHGLHGIGVGSCDVCVGSVHRE